MRLACYPLTDLAFVKWQWQKKSLGFLFIPFFFPPNPGFKIELPILTNSLYTEDERKGISACEGLEFTRMRDNMG